MAKLERPVVSLPTPRFLRQLSVRVGQSGAAEERPYFLLAVGQQRLLYRLIYLRSVGIGGDEPELVGLLITEFWFS